MNTVLKTSAVAGALVLFASGTAHAQQTTAPQTQPNDKAEPAETAPAAPAGTEAEAAPLPLLIPSASVRPEIGYGPDGFQKPFRVVTLEDGRTMSAFAKDDKLPPLPEGATKRVMGNGIIVYVSAYGPATLLPHRVKGIIKADGPYEVVKTGAIIKDDVIINVPFRYNRVFKMTADHTVNIMFSKKDLLYAKAGTMGFYAGRYGAMEEMVCYFGKAEPTIYKRALCGLKFAGVPTTVGFTLVNTDGNLPLRYSVTTVYGASTAPHLRGFESVEVDEKIPYAFGLKISFVKWTSKGVFLEWRSDGAFVHSEVYPYGADGKAVIDYVEGRLIVTPYAKDKKAATVVWEPQTLESKP